MIALLAEERWTISDLARITNAGLRIAGIHAVGRRAADTVTDRTIRYYTTLGLVDRPAGWQGVQGLYGRRHLMQLLAIKRRQSDGLSTHELQRQLPDLSNARLEALARLPVSIEELEQRAEAVAGGHAQFPDTRRPGQAALFSAHAAEEPPASYGESTEPDASDAGIMLRAIQLPAGLVLLCPAGQVAALTPEDVDAVRVVLLRTLVDRGVLPPEAER
jgi:DNA-binding transcriptional MerR regulator